MTLLRSERLAAVILLAAAVVGLVLANSPLGHTALEVQHAALGPLSVGHWISDGLLAVFFFAAAVELKHELAHGELTSVKRAMRPAIAAVFGVAVPALVYLVIAGRDFPNGWPIPTATDIAFALGVLALCGRGLIPSRIRVFLLALAVIDDIIAIAIIAVFFTTSVDWLALLLSVVCVVVAGVLSRVRHRSVVPLVVLAACGAWWFMVQSGVHATIAGVLVGLAVALRPGQRARHILEPAINGAILPLFALSAALVAVPDVGGTGLASAFWGIAIALPLGKIVGIGLGGVIGAAIARERIDAFALVTVGALGGIGFTVSLLMNELAFASHDDIRAEGTLAVLLGSGASIVLAGVLVALLAGRYRRARRAQR